jgi:hypothetical protein
MEILDEQKVAKARSDIRDLLMKDRAAVLATFPTTLKHDSAQAECFMGRLRTFNDQVVGPTLIAMPVKSVQEVCTTFIESSESLPPCVESRLLRFTAGTTTWKDALSVFIAETADPGAQRVAKKAILAMAMRAGERVATYARHDYCSLSSSSASWAAPVNSTTQPWPNASSTDSGRTYLKAWRRD